MFEYTLTLSQNQAHEVLTAVELLMRLKLGQYQELVYTLCDIYNPEKTIQISVIDDILKQAFNLMNKDKTPAEYKDDEWHRLYDIYQVLRKAIHDAETPDADGVDSYPPFQTAKEPLPSIKWNKK